MSEHRKQAEEWLSASSIWESPDERSTPMMLAAVTHALLALGDALTTAAVPPGPCWHDSGITWPDGDHPRCELLAGHAGAHQCDRGAMGGTAVWTDTTRPHAAATSVAGEGL